MLVWGDFLPSRKFNRIYLDPSLFTLAPSDLIHFLGLFPVQIAILHHIISLQAADSPRDDNSRAYVRLFHSETARSLLVMVVWTDVGMNRIFGSFRILLIVVTVWRDARSSKYVEKR
jgi:hypothetical protein